MASIRQRSKNTWAVIYQNGEGDDRHQEWESGYTRNQAKARKAKIEREEALGIQTHIVNEEHHSLREKFINSAQIDKVYFKFPSSDPRSKSMVVLKNTKEDGGSDRNAYLPEMVYSKIMKLREMQQELKIVLGDSYYDYGMMICQENGKPAMTEHLNKRFQRVLNEMGIKTLKWLHINAHALSTKIAYGLPTP